MFKIKKMINKSDINPVLLGEFDTEEHSNFKPGNMVTYCKYNGTRFEIKEITQEDSLYKLSLEAKYKGSMGYEPWREDLLLYVTKT